MKRSVKSSALLAAASAAVLAAFPAVADTPQIINGDFENQTFALTCPNSCGTFYLPDNWTVAAAGAKGGRKDSDLSTVLHGAPGGHYWGAQYLMGTEAANGTSTIASISQNVTGLTIGSTYEISFWSLATHFSNAAVGAHWEASIGSTTFEGQVPLSYPSTTWVQDSFQFVATATSQLLKFSPEWPGATPGVTPEILNIDGIRITTVSAVPEASSLSMLLAGIAVVGLFVTRRRNKAPAP